MSDFTVNTSGFRSTANQMKSTSKEWKSFASKLQSLSGLIGISDHPDDAVRAVRQASENLSRNSSDLQHLSDALLEAETTYFLSEQEALAIVSGVPSSSIDKFSSILKKLYDVIGGIDGKTLAVGAAFGPLGALISLVIPGFGSSPDSSTKELIDLVAESELYDYIIGNQKNIKAGKKLTETLQTLHILSDDNQLAKDLKDITDSDLFKGLEYGDDALTLYQVLQSYSENGYLSEEDSTELVKLVKSYGTKGLKAVLEGEYGLEGGAAGAWAGVAVNAIDNLTDVGEYYDGTFGGFAKYLWHSTGGALLDTGADTGSKVVKTWDRIFDTEFTDKWENVSDRNDFDQKLWDGLVEIKEGFQDVGFKEGVRCVVGGIDQSIDELETSVFKKGVELIAGKERATVIESSWKSLTGEDDVMVIRDVRNLAGQAADYAKNEIKSFFSSSSSTINGWASKVRTGIPSLW